jgi:hypothetical protein
MVKNTQIPNQGKPKRKILDQFHINIASAKP